jgi:hypothetical protein
LALKYCSSIGVFITTISLRQCSSIERWETEASFE